MIKSVTLLSSFVLFSICSIAQTPIDIAENTVKISAGGEENFYYGFAEGDQLVFNLEELNGKELKEFEIMAMPSSSLYLEYKIKKIQDKMLTIPESGIYRFRFANSNLFAGRVCRFKVQRIPADASRKFNTTVYKRNVFDTSYYTVQEQYVLRSDTTISEILNQTAKVHSSLNANGNRSFANFVLPPNTISWAYYIGVDQAGQQAYEQASQKLAEESPKLLSRLATLNPLASVALGLMPYIAQLQSGEDIDYYIVHSEYSSMCFTDQPFSFIKRGKVINDFAKLSPIKGNLSFCFSNDNALSAVSVLVKVTAVQVEHVIATRDVQKMNVVSREELYLKNE